MTEPQKMVPLDALSPTPRALTRADAERHAVDAIPVGTGIVLTLEHATTLLRWVNNSTTGRETAERHIARIALRDALHAAHDAAQT